MGNTIRRQPISSKIPASPNYKFLNITDFKGLDISDNPFILKPNTASDLLNVYVDENNALSTRPRLEKTHDFSWLIGDGELIGVYNITDGYLIHVNVDGVYKMYNHPADAENNEISGDIPTAKCSVFEKNDTIYMLDANKYYALKDMNVGLVEPYVPTIIQASIDNRDGGSYETLNILANKYKETYFWDKFEIPELTANVVDVENETYKEYLFDEQLEGLVVLNYYNKQIIAVRKSDRHLVLGTFSDDLSSVTFEDTLVDLPYTMSAYVNRVVLVENSLSFYFFGDTGADCVYITKTADGLKKETINLSYENFNTITPLFSFPNGSCLLYWNRTNTNKFSGYDRSKKEAFDVVYDSDYAPHALVVIDNDLYFMKDEIESLFWGENFLENRKVEFKIGLNMELSGDNTSSIVPYKDGVVVLDYVGNGVYVDFKDLVVEKITSNTESYGDLYHLVSTNKGLIGKTSTTSFAQNTTRNTALFVIQETEGLFRTSFSGLKVDESAFRGEDDVVLMFKYEEENDIFFVAKSSKNNHSRFSLLVRNDNRYPHLTVVKKIVDAELNTLLDWREKFSKSSLVKRFENNWWFASGNTIFRTENNDPTYIPLDEEFEIGDSKDPITGFNIAQDDLLLAYKKNNIYAIQPYEAYDRLTYSILETKNVSGNNAIGSTIVTALTEIPVHISYDGIFALKQLKNVQSSDRISEPISDNINKRWLKESKSAIDTCQTINRLYWTYFVLKERDVTKVYLLDNRTQSWFYWELPITSINVFVKDETTIFVDENGMVYKLTTDDIINEYNKDVTEYYDNGKKLIKWFWKSQILPLGTINYSKKLVDTTFIVADTDDSDEYGLNYKFRAYRKLVSESNETTISNRLNYVQSTTKKTLIPRFNFLQLEISNVEDDLNNNKLRLLGLGLKYVLLEGLL